MDRGEPDTNWRLSRALKYLEQQSDNINFASQVAGSGKRVKPGLKEKYVQGPQLEMKRRESIQEAYGKLNQQDLVADWLKEGERSIHMTSGSGFDVFGI